MSSPQALHDMVKNLHLPRVATERMWIHCPYCGAKHSIYDNTASSSGVFLLCYRGCKKEFELVIEDGKQVLKK